MTGRLVALIFLTFAYLNQTAEIPQQIILTVVEVGGNVTLDCPVSEKEGLFFQWYKQPLGYMVQTVATGSFKQQRLSEKFDNNRFKITEWTDKYALTIRNVMKEDEATYFCQNGSAYLQSFAAGFYLAVKDPIENSFSQVRQTPQTVSVQEGDPVTINCSLLSKTKVNTERCSGENRVYWFRVGEGESHPNFVYTQKKCNESQERRSCEYQLSKTIQNSQDVGTYYCAVVTCGKILLGQGTKVDKAHYFIMAVIILGMLLACCGVIIIILVVYISHIASTGVNGDTSHSEHEQSTRSKPKNENGDADEVNYVALNFSTRKAKGMKKRKESPQECVYSSVAAVQSTLQEPSGSTTCM